MLLQLFTDLLGNQLLDKALDKLEQEICTEGGRDRI